MASEQRYCPECGSDIYAASHYEALVEARDRHHRMNQKQALDILRLQLRVGELQDERRYRGRKVEMQRRVIRRLEKKLRSLSVWPHDDKQVGEGDPASPTPKHELMPHHDPAAEGYADARGLRKMRKRVKGEGNG